MSHLLRIVTLLLALMITGTAQAATKAQLDAQLSPYVTDAAQRDFLATEATAAGVSEFHFVGSAALWAKCPGGDYGCSTYKTGSRRGDVYLNVEVAGGTGVTNITHEVAHIAAFRKGCYAHGDVWLEYLMGMAQRYETAFPGKKWGKSSPAASVQAKYQRYAGERKSCKTANTPDLRMAFTQLQVQVPATFTQALTGQIEVDIQTTDPGKHTSKTLLTGKMAVAGPGLFVFDFNSAQGQRAVSRGDLICASIKKAYYLETNSDGTQSTGGCYGAGGKLSKGPSIWTYEPTSDGVLVFKYTQIHQF